MSDDHYRPPIVDEIWALVKENQEGLKKLRATQQETAELIRENAERQKKTEEIVQETSKQLKKTDDRFNSQWGKLVESLVAGKLVELLREKQIAVSGIGPRWEASYRKENGELKHKEFDIVALNGLEFVLVEVKTTLKTGHVKYFLEAMRDAKKYFPAHAKKKAYGGVAYLTCDSQADVYAERQGLFVIKATGDSAKIINKPGFKPKAFG